MCTCSDFGSQGSCRLPSRAARGKSPSFPADPGEVPDAAPVDRLQGSLPTMIPGSAGGLRSAAFEPGPARSKPNSVAEAGRGHSAEAKQGKQGSGRDGHGRELGKATDAPAPRRGGGGIHFG